MLEEPIEGIDYWSINTDSQALGRSRSSSSSSGGSLVQTVQIGSSVTRGLGAGGDPEVGRAAAEESVSELKRLVEGSDLCFVAAGMGGGTGSGAAPVLAKMAKQAGALTVAIVTKPFAFEGRRRKKQAEDAIAKLRENVDTLILVSNDKLLEVIPEGTPLTAAFRVADDVLRQGVVGIAEIIVRPGLVNVDFADVRAVLQDAGSAIIGIGNGNGPNAAEDAAVAALGSPLLDENYLDVANGVVFNILGGPSMTLSDVNRAANVIYDTVTEDANVIFGASVDENIADNEIFVTVLATGFQKKI
jgi:cell division protein FtsZ